MFQSGNMNREEGHIQADSREVIRKTCTMGFVDMIILFSIESVAGCFEHDIKVRVLKQVEDFITN